MAPATPNDLLDWLVRNQFLSAARAHPFRSPPAEYGNTVALARDFMQRDWLTPYQANQILQGKGDQLVLGAYRLVEKLGAGTMGQVFKGWSQKLELPVAIKMIHKVHLASRKAIDRFRREMETAGKLDHPHIVLLRDADEIDNHPFMVMDYVHGTNLARQVKQDGPLPVGQAAEYARQAALGLQHAYERGVVHRDIKPGNLLVNRTGVPLVRISDFGLARLGNEGSSERRLTQHGAVLGTIDYIAPEQAENAQNADSRSDIYSLGCSLYFLLTANPPFPGSSVVEKVSARLSGQPTDIHVYRPEVPDGLAAVISRMTARQPRDRYQTPGEAAVALQSFCERSGGARAARAQQSAEAPRALLAIPVASADARDPFRFSDGDTANDVGEPADIPEPAARAVSRRAVKKSRVGLYAVGGMAALLIALFLLLRGCGSVVPRDVYPANASLAITLKEKERTLAPGDRKRVVFTIRRSNFSGKVEVSLEKIPEGIGPNPNSVTLDANKVEAELPLFVYQFAKRETSRLRIRAAAKNISAEDWLQLTVAGPDR
jgi:hypothetical protein